MVYGRLAEGDRVWTAVAGPGLSADINELQDQLAAICQARWMDITLLGQPQQSAGSFVRPYWELTPERWLLDSSDYLSLQIPVREQQKITGVFATLSYSSGASTGGVLRLTSQSAAPTGGGSLPAKTTEWSYADPWNIAGTPGDLYSISATGLSIIAQAKTTYWLQVLGLGTQDCYVHRVNIQAQLGT